MENILILVRNTLKITFRKKGNIIVYLFLPLAGVLLSMAIYSSAGTQPINVGLVDKDKSTISMDFAKALKATGSYTLTTLDENEIKGKLLDQKLDAAIIIPAAYGESIYKNSPEKMEVISIKGLDITVWVNNFIDIYTRNLSDISFASGGDRASFDKMYEGHRNNPVNVSEIKLKDVRTGKNITLSSMGFLIMFIMLGAGLTSQFILNEKKARTYYRICSTPVKSREFITGNVMTSFLIVMVQVAFIQIIMKYLLRIETFVPDLLMYLILVMFGIVAISIGLVVTAFSSSSYMAGTLSSLVLTPTCMLGGCYWSVTLMPDFMQKISWFMPQRWAIDAIQKMQAGGGMNEILMNIVILLAFSAALMLIAIYKFSRASGVQKFV